MNSRKQVLKRFLPFLRRGFADAFSLASEIESVTTLFIARTSACAAALPSARRVDSLKEHPTDRKRIAPDCR